MIVADIFGMDGIIVLIIVVVVLFGSSQLPKLARNIGSAGREFRRGHQETDGEVAPVESELRHELPVAQALSDLDGKRATTLRGVGRNDDQPTGEDAKKGFRPREG